MVHSVVAFFLVHVFVNSLNVYGGCACYSSTDWCWCNDIETQQKCYRLLDKYRDFYNQLNNYLLSLMDAGTFTKNDYLIFHGESQTKFPKQFCANSTICTAYSNHRGTGYCYSIPTRNDNNTLIEYWSTYKGAILSINAPVNIMSEV